jgi:hypothetical protein
MVTISSRVLSVAPSTWLLAAACAVIAVLLYRFLLNTFGPNDRTGNGITIGDAKVFDNRSLTLMLEQLDSSLRTFNVVNQNVAQNLELLQGTRSTEETGSARVGWKPQIPWLSGRKKDGAAESKDAGGQPDARSAQPSSPKPAEAPSGVPALGISAADALTEQLNLAYQIFNLRVLNERALSDRLYHPEGESEPKPRLQVVLGFQVSINPPEGMQDCAAIAEISLQTQAGNSAVSVVALIPQEKTYNSAALSTRSKSLDGSVVSNVLTVGGSTGRTSRELYLHRDADTLAFERPPGWKAGAFWPRQQKPGTSSEAIFGWEFRPVLGRRSVSPGTRQMLAVVALPCSDESSSVKLKVQTRSYWRAYNRRRQTTAPRWGWWPLRYRSARQIDRAPQEVEILPSARVQNALKPEIENASWVDAGDGSAMVVVEGKNFFSGTEVTLGGVIHHDPKTQLVLKSDRAFEVRTTLEALGTGEGLLSGRFGPAIPLALPPKKLPVPAIAINQNQSRLYLAAGGYRQLVLWIRPAKFGVPFGCADLKKLPDPLIFVNGKPIPTPYDYLDWAPPAPPHEPGAAPPGHEQQPHEPSKPEAVMVTASVPAVYVDEENPVVLFKVPFCGTDWVVRSMIYAGAPTVTRLGGSQQTSIIISSAGYDFWDDWIATVDKDYPLNSPEFRKLDRRTLQLTLPSDVLCSFSKIALRSKVADASYILVLPEPQGHTEP